MLKGRYIKLLIRCWLDTNINWYVQLLMLLLHALSVAAHRPPTLPTVIFTVGFMYNPISTSRNYEDFKNILPDIWKELHRFFIKYFCCIKVLSDFCDVQNTLLLNLDRSKVSFSVAAIITNTKTKTQGRQQHFLIIMNWIDHCFIYSICTKPRLSRV